MASTSRADIALAMFVETKDVFMKNLKQMPTPQYAAYMSDKPSTKAAEKYGTVGNLKPAHIKAEGEAVQYGTITTGNETTITNQTVSNGLEVNMEAQEDDQWGVIPAAKVSELARTMQSMRETECAAVWNNVRTATGADGVAYAATNHPCINSGGAHTNSNLQLLTIDNSATGWDNYVTCVQVFDGYKNHWGEKFDTQASAVLCNKNRQYQLAALMNSNLKPFEASNTKNTVPQLKTIFSTYLSALPLHFLDETIESAVLQRRKGITMQYDYDKRSTFNFYFNVHERYKAGMINPGFGFVTCAGANS